jgi:hypothetical protein
MYAAKHEKGFEGSTEKIGDSVSMQKIAEIQEQPYRDLALRKNYAGENEHDLL